MGRIREAVRKDLSALVALENESFDGDRLTRDQYRRFISKATSVVLVAEGVKGSLVMLLRSNSQIGRVYSIAVSQEVRGTGVAQALLEAAAEEAKRRGCHELRAEVREDNAASRRMFAKEGWQEFGRYSNFYQDGADALRYSKKLTVHAKI